MPERAATDDGAARPTEAAGLPPVVRERLHQERETRGWSLRAAGRHLGCSAPMLLRLERGDRIPGEELADRLVDVYGLDQPTAEQMQRRVEWLADPDRDLDVPDLDDPTPAVSLGPAHQMEAAGDGPLEDPASADDPADWLLDDVVDLG